MPEEPPLEDVYLKLLHPGRRGVSEPHIRACSARSSPISVRISTIFLPSLHRDRHRDLHAGLVAVIVPAVTGERLSDSGDLEIALEMYQDRIP